MRVAIPGGANIRRSRTAGYQRSINVYSELNGDPQGPLGSSHYNRPGLVPQIGPFVQGPIRLVHLASNGMLFIVANQGLYFAPSAYGAPSGNPQYNPSGFLAGGLVFYQVNKGVFIDEETGTPSATAVPTATVAGVGRCWAKDNAGHLLIGSTGPDLGTGLGNIYHVAIPQNPPGSFVGPYTMTIDTIVARTLGGVQALDYLDTYFLALRDNTFMVSLSNSIAFPAQFQLRTTSDPNGTVAIRVIKRHVIIFGIYRTEIWYNAGGPTFPFAELPNVYIEFGAFSSTAVVVLGEMIYFLACTREGLAGVYRINNFRAEKISSPTIDERLFQVLSSWANVYSLTNAQGNYVNLTPWILQQCQGEIQSEIENSTMSEILRQSNMFAFRWKGHGFIGLTFGNETWVYDESTNDWHQWGIAAGDGLSVNRMPWFCSGPAKDLVYFGSDNSAYAYVLTEQSYDTFVAIANPVHQVIPPQVIGVANTPQVFIKGIPMPMALPSVDNPLAALPVDAQMVQLSKVALDFVTDQSDNTIDGTYYGQDGTSPAKPEPYYGWFQREHFPHQVFLRVSTDRGHTWTEYPMIDTGTPPAGPPFAVVPRDFLGVYQTQPMWRLTAMGRDIRMEVRWQGPGGLNAAFVDGTVLPGT